MGSLIKVVASSRLPFINRCVISSSRAFAATQRSSFSTIINDDCRRDGHGFKNNLHRVRNVTLHRISNFIYENIMNRFGLFTRFYGINVKTIEPLEVETDECLYCHLEMNGVISHENVRVSVYHNEFHIQAVVYDEFKATYRKYRSRFWFPEEDSYYLKYNMRGIRAEFSEGELLLHIPKFNAEERMLNQKKNEAGEFSKLKKDAFMFGIKVHVADDI